MRMQQYYVNIIEEPRKSWVETVNLCAIGAKCDVITKNQLEEIQCAIDREIKHTQCKESDHYKAESLIRQYIWQINVAMYG